MTLKLTRPIEFILKSWNNFKRLYCHLLKYRRLSVWERLKFYKGRKMLIWSSTNWPIKKRLIRSCLGWVMYKGVVMGLLLGLVRGWGKRVIQVQSWVVIWLGRTLLKGMVVIHYWITSSGRGDCPLQNCQLNSSHELSVCFKRILHYDFFFNIA